MVAAMAAAGPTIYLNRTPPCKGKIVIATGPNGAPLECLCEQAKRGACFDPGPYVAEWVRPGRSRGAG
jgi:hypothetical protein